ncbi:MAG: Fmu (Sun) domain-containing protein [Chitinophagaceae bacterium]|nr:Fmu (Sun) domain-containing protein [Chitinophagaceae bacterium]
MSRYHSYLNSAKAILKKYRGDEPFSSFLKIHFSVNKKFGSKDRKQVAHLCYCFFRLGKAALYLSEEDRILTALFLCSSNSDEMLAVLKPEWNDKAQCSFEEKLSVIPLQFSATEIFPWKDELSKEVDASDYSHSFLIQPNLFLRLRPGYEKKLFAKLEKAEIEFETIGTNCLSFSNATKLEEIVELNREAVIQDYSSQQVGKIFRSINEQLVRLGRSGQPLRVWDCCAASGGKSILAKDIFGEVDLTVSDIRESILFNLKKRFTAAGINKYRSYVADLTASALQLSPMDFIICDVPCTGSGTWSRTPEQLYFFDIATIAGYAALQKKIASNALKNLNKGGWFLYITCSVFRKENEEVVDYLVQTFLLNIISMKTITGYSDKADTMFVAMMQRS